MHVGVDLAAVHGRLDCRGCNIQGHARWGEAAENVLRRTRAWPGFGRHAILHPEVRRERDRGLLGGCILHHRGADGLLEFLELAGLRACRLQVLPEGVRQLCVARRPIIGHLAELHLAREARRGSDDDAGHVRPRLAGVQHGPLVAVGTRPDQNNDLAQGFSHPLLSTGACRKVNGAVLVLFGNATKLLLVELSSLQGCHGELCEVHQDLGLGWSQ
mmetsp:Transcript_41161/g.132493  ORF Transcript_41161/g.132493 Transcript_41161/m.132493 type:complete len:216 (+) Transcript_41161:1417-2064(+)